MTKFEELIINQLQYGGKKYASTSLREATDELTQDFGFNGLLWTLGKYCKRFKTLGLEKEPLKLGTYFYIIWLKLGYHLSPNGTATINDTVVATKELFFPMFRDRLEKCDLNFDNSVLETTVPLKEWILASLYDLIMDLRYYRDEERVLKCFRYAEGLWLTSGFDKVEHHTTDTGEKLRN